MSTSTTVVSWALVCSDSIIRVAMTLRSRLIFSVVPRRDAGTVEVVAAAGADAAAGAAGAGAAAGAAGWAAAWAAAVGAGAVVPCLAAASSTSCLRILPPTPVPATVARSTSCWAAILRTSGVT